MTSLFTNRRAFLSGLLAASLAPRPSWADVGAPAYLAAGKTPSGGFVLCGLRADGSLAFELPLPGRGHAAAGHPIRPEAVAFARRPGTYALVLDCRSGDLLAEMTAPEGRHFYGHGAFSADGSLLFTPENDYEAGEGRIGIWDAARSYRRIGEVASHGIGPHQILRLPGQDILAVANGGIDTHPDTGRTKLNIPFMEPNLSYVSFDGDLLDQVAPPPEWHKNSLRHLAVREDGLIACALQWQGEIAKAPPLLALHRRGEDLRFAAFEAPYHTRMNGYGGSVAFSGDGMRVAVTSPRGSEVQIFDAETGTPLERLTEADACGVAAAQGGFFLTAGTGHIRRGALRAADAEGQFPVAWDNHIINLALDRLS